MKTTPLPSQERLKELLDYDPENGLLIWKTRPSRSAGRFNKYQAGNEALAVVSPKGYKRGMIDQVCYATHRIVFKWWHGFDPVEVDHINGNRQDNRIKNLRSVSRRENTRNHRKRREGELDTPVCVSRMNQQYRATVCVEGRNHYLGFFDTPEQASAAVDAFLENLPKPPTSAAS